jgi:hypothetical protein
MEHDNKFAELTVMLDKISRKLDYLYRHIGLEYADESVPVYVLRAQEMVREGRDNEAIKIVREHTAVGMLEARAIVEDMARRIGRMQLHIESVVPPAGVAGARSVIGDTGASQAAVEDAWRRAVRESDAQRL